MSLAAGPKKGLRPPAYKPGGLCSGFLQKKPPPHGKWCWYTWWGVASRGRQKKTAMGFRKQSFQEGDQGERHVDLDTRAKTIGKGMGVGVIKVRRGGGGSYII